MTPDTLRRLLRLALAECRDGPRDLGRLRLRALARALEAHGSPEAAGMARVAADAARFRDVDFGALEAAVTEALQ